MAKKKSKKEFSYYLNPKTDELIVLDIKENEIIIVPMIEEVSYEGKLYIEGDEEQYEEPGGPKEKEKERKEKKGGRRKRTPVTKEIREKAKELIEDGKNPHELMEGLGVGETTAYKLYREIKKEIQKDVGKP